MRAHHRRRPRPASVVTGLAAIAAVAGLLVATPHTAAAQTRQQMAADWQRQRETVLAYIDAMPDSALGFRPTPGVRDFAEQIVHLASTNLFVAATTFHGLTDVPFALDSTQLHQKAALRDYTDRTYTYVLDAVKAATPSQLLKRSSLFNEPAESTSRWLALSYEHAVWTLGQTIPYVRLNGVTPPNYKIPF